MDEQHLTAATRYVERNPVKATLAARAQGWPWSSAAAHVASRGDEVAEGESQKGSASQNRSGTFES